MGPSGALRDASDRDRTVSVAVRARRPARFIAVVIAGCLTLAACSSDSDGSDAAVAESGEATTSSTANQQESTSTAPAPPVELIIPEIAGTITLGEDLGAGRTIELAGADLEAVVDSVADSRRFSEVAFGGQIPPDFAAFVLTQQIFLVVMQERLDAANGFVDPIEREAARGAIIDELSNALTSPAEGESVAAEVEPYVELIADLRATNTAIGTALLTSAEPGQGSPCVRHILVDTEPEASDIMAELDGGADFSELAVERSTGPSGPDGGDLGCAPSSNYVPEFQAAVDAAELGAPVGPVQTQFGFHVLIVDRFQADASGLASELLQLDLAAITVEVDPGIGSWDSTTSAVLPTGQ